MYIYRGAGICDLAHLWLLLQPPFPIYNYRQYCLCCSPECCFNLCLPLSLLLLQLELNPGPFNIKEHVLITIFVSGEGGRDPNLHLIGFSKPTTISSLHQSYVDLDSCHPPPPPCFSLLPTPLYALSPLVGCRRTRVLGSDTATHGGLTFSLSSRPSTSFPSTFGLGWSSSPAPRYPKKFNNNNYYHHYYNYMRHMWW